MVPALFSRIPDLLPSKATDSDTERHLLFAAVVGLLASMSDHQLVILAFDDLQWADKGSLLLLRHLASGTQAVRVLVLGTYRDSELSPSHPLLDTLAALHREGRLSMPALPIRARLSTVRPMWDRVDPSRTPIEGSRAMPRCRPVRRVGSDPARGSGTGR